MRWGLFWFFIASLIAGAALATDNARPVTAPSIVAQAELARYKALFSEWDLSATLYSKQVTVTSYTSRAEETDSSPHITACNTPVVVGGVAVSRDLFELIGGCGKKVLLKGYGTLTINDKMNRRYKNSVDIWAGDLKAARLHGRQTAELIWQ